MFDERSPPPLLAVERERVEAAALLDPGRLVEALSSSAASCSARSAGAGRARPRARARRAPLCVVGVPLTSTAAIGASAKSRPGSAANHRSPSTTGSRGRVGVRPSRRSRPRRDRRNSRSTRGLGARAAHPFREASRRPSSASSPEQDEVERHGVDRAVVARGPRLGAAASRTSCTIFPARRRSSGHRPAPEVAERVERAGCSLRAEKQGLQRRHLHVAPNTVMNHGMPGGEERHAVLAARIRKAARSRPSGRTRGEGYPTAADSGTQSVQASTTSPRVSSSSSSCSIVSSVIVEPRTTSTLTSQLLTRLERESEGHRVPSSQPRSVKASRVPVTELIDDRDLSPPLIVVRRRGAGAAARARDPRLEVVELTRDDVHEVGFGLERDLERPVSPASRSAPRPAPASRSRRTAARNREGVPVSNSRFRLQR